MNSRIVELHEIRSTNNEWAGTFLALHEDGSFSRILTGEIDGKQAVCVIPLPVVNQA